MTWQNKQGWVLLLFLVIVAFLFAGSDCSFMRVLRSLNVVKRH
jgi:hypothetical protein